MLDHHSTEIPKTANVSVCKLNDLISLIINYLQNPIQNHVQTINNYSISNYVSL